MRLLSVRGGSEPISWDDQTLGIRFVHTADLQIGKSFGQFPPDIAAVLRTGRLETLKRIAALARDRGVDAVLVAGDPSLPTSLRHRPRLELL